MFVIRRVSDIRKITENYEWKYVPTETNPADLQTRGISETQFSSSTLWTNGPSWITDETKWPIWNENPLNKTVLASLSDQQDETMTQSMNQQRLAQIMDLSKYSSLKKLLAVTCYMMRFVNYCKKFL